MGFRLICTNYWAQLRVVLCQSESTKLETSLSYSLMSATQSLIQPLDWSPSHELIQPVIHPANHAHPICIPTCHPTYHLTKNLTSANLPIDLTCPHLTSLDLINHIWHHLISMHSNKDGLYHRYSMMLLYQGLV